jgi:hypothetical protein
MSGVNITAAVFVVKVTACLYKKEKFTNFNPSLSCAILKVNVPSYLRFVVLMVVTEDDSLLGLWQHVVC